MATASILKDSLLADHHLLMRPMGPAANLRELRIKAVGLSDWARAPQAPPNADHQTGRLD